MPSPLPATSWKGSGRPNTAFGRADVVGWRPGVDERTADLVVEADLHVGIDAAGHDGARVAAGIDRGADELRCVVGLAGGADDDDAALVGMVDGAAQRMHLLDVADDRLDAEADRDHVGQVAVDGIHDGVGGIQDGLAGQHHAVGDAVGHDRHARADADVDAGQVAAQRAQGARAVTGRDHQPAATVQRIAGLGHADIDVVDAAIGQQGGSVARKIEDDVVGEARVEMGDQDAVPVEIGAKFIGEQTHRLARADGTGVPVADGHDGLPLWEGLS